MSNTSIDNILASFVLQQEKGNQLILNLINTLVQQLQASEANYKNALTELEKLKKTKK